MIAEVGAEGVSNVVAGLALHAGMPPDQIRANATSNSSRTASTSTAAPDRVTNPKSCNQTSSSTSRGVIRWGTSSITLSPMFSSMGRMSDNGTGSPVNPVVVF